MRNGAQRCFIVSIRVRRVKGQPFGARLSQDCVDFHLGIPSVSLSLSRENLRFSFLRLLLALSIVKTCSGHLFQATLGDRVKPWSRRGEIKVQLPRRIVGCPPRTHEGRRHRRPARCCISSICAPRGHPLADAPRRASCHLGDPSSVEARRAPSKAFPALF